MKKLKKLFFPSCIRKVHFCKGSFTLVEMLVVISIIAVLAAMLLPAMSKGIDVAKDISCAGNLHGLGVGVQLYLQDYNGYMPYKDVYAPALYTAGNSTYHGHAKLKELGYIDDVRLFWCGSEDTPNKMNSSGHYKRGAENFMQNPPLQDILTNIWYRYAYSSKTGYQDLPTERIAAIKSPSQTGLFMCASQPSNPENNSITDRYDIHGGRGFSLAMVDNTVVFYDFSVYGSIEFWTGSRPYNTLFPLRALDNAVRYFQNGN